MGRVAAPATNIAKTLAALAFAMGCALDDGPASPAERCAAALSAGDCVAVDLGDEESARCRWTEVRSYDDTSSCHSEVHSECIAYSGISLGCAPYCEGGTTGGHYFWRITEDGTEVVSSPCGPEPEGFAACRGGAACDCACAGTP